MRLTIGRAILAAILVQWVLEWISWSYPPSSALGHWSIVAARAILYVSLGVVAVRRGRRWSAPLVALSAALAATLSVALVGILTGQFLARGMGPALVFAYIITIAAFSLLSGATGAAGAYWRSRTGIVRAPVA